MKEILFLLLLVVITALNVTAQKKLFTASDYRQHFKGETGSKQCHNFCYNDKNFEPIIRY